METPVEKPKRQPRRGISPVTLIAQVKNTVPFVFDPALQPGPRERHLRVLRLANRAMERGSDYPCDHVGYFEICLAAHHGTVASFVPTDVDNQIRQRLWDPALGVETKLQMNDLVKESYRWSCDAVSTRIVHLPETDEKMSGHNGEWFSTAVGAYAALRRRAPEAAALMREQILFEVRRESDMYEGFKARGLGMELLKAATIIAHNLGDLDRVIDMWALTEEDPLNEAVYRASHGEKPGWPALAEAGELNKAYMAIENHRHFTLRTPRSLRRHAELLLPIAPFLDEWGGIVARHPDLSPEEVGSVVEALVDGWERLEGPIGYSRALAGIEENFPGGLTHMCQNVPRRIAARLKTGALRSLCSIPRERFEGHWNQAALKLARKLGAGPATPCTVAFRGTRQGPSARPQEEGAGYS